MPRKTGSCRNLMFLATATAMSVAFSKVTLGTTTTWTGNDSDSWSDSGNWNNGTPGTGVDADVFGSAYMVYDYAGPTITLGALQLFGATNVNNGETFSMSEGDLASIGEGIGLSNIATFNQSGGTNSPNGFQLGVDSGSTGTYDLSGTGVLAVSGQESIGSNNPLGGAGIFSQSGGSNTTSTLEIVSGSKLSTYSLSGGALVASSEFIGAGEGGIFNQTGGTNTVQNGSPSTELDIAGFPGIGPLGAYNLSGGSLTVDGGVYVGGSSTQGEIGYGTLTVSSSGQMTAIGTLQVFGHSSVNISGTVPQVGGLTIATGGVVSINSGLLITSDGGSPAAAEAAIQQYLDSGAIVSSEVMANAELYGIAYADGSDSGLLSAELQKGQVVVEPDLIGDADMNGVVNVHDLQNLLSGFGNAGFWDQGNFNNHATVDFNDLQLLLGNFGDSTTLSYSELSGIENLVGEYGYVATPNASGQGFRLTAVPEPASAALMVAGIGMMMWRRRAGWRNRPIWAD